MVWCMVVILYMLSLSWARHWHRFVRHMQGRIHVEVMLFGGLPNCVLALIMMVLHAWECSRRSLCICHTTLLCHDVRMLLMMRFCAHREQVEPCVKGLKWAEGAKGDMESIRPYGILPLVAHVLTISQFESLCDLSVCTCGEDHKQLEMGECMSGLCCWHNGWWMWLLMRQRVMMLFVNIYEWVVLKMCKVWEGWCQKFVFLLHTNTFQRVWINGLILELRSI